MVISERRVLQAMAYTNWFCLLDVVTGSKAGRGAETKMKLKPLLGQPNQLSELKLVLPSCAALFLAVLAPPGIHHYSLIVDCSDIYVE